jgi:hypothetical protein
MSPGQLLSRVARISSLSKYVHVQEPDFSACIYVEYGLSIKPGKTEYLARKYKRSDEPMDEITIDSNP